MVKERQFVTSGFEFRKRSRISGIFRLHGVWHLGHKYIIAGTLNISV